MIDHRSIMFQIEGQCIQHAAARDRVDGAAFSRAVADGAINALIRVDGREAAAEYAAQMSDRVLMGIRTQTDYPPVAVRDAVEMPAPPPVKNQPMRFFSIFVAGWLCGFYTGWVAR